MSVGLILEGGGTRGVYTAGVLDALIDNKIFVNDVYGVSAGACMRVRTTSGPTMSGGLGKNHAGIGAMTSTVITGVPARATHMRLRFVAIHASVTLSSPSVKRLAERIKAEDNRRELVH